MKGLNHEYMGSTGAPPAAWQGPEDKEEPSQQPTQETASHTEILTPPMREMAKRTWDLLKAHKRM